MTSIDHLIGELLVRHNCVIVPMFGGFVAKSTPAVIDFDRGVMLPPSKSLLFNRQLINNDGLLVNELASKLNISFDKALVEVNSKVATWTKELSAGGRIEIDKVGYLFYNEEKNICFEQDRFFNLLLESFGLGQVQFISEEKAKTDNRTHVIQPKIDLDKENKDIAPKIIKLSGAPEPIVEKPLENETPNLVGKESRQVWKYIAAACLLPIAFYSFWIPMKTDVLESGIISIKDFNPFYNSTEGVYKKHNLIEKPLSHQKGSSLENKIQELPVEVGSYSYKVDNAQYVLVRLNKVETALSSNTFPDKNVSPEAMNYVVGCFSNEENARNLVEKLKFNGMDARIVDFSNGLHRVSAGSAISLDALNKIESEANSLGFKGWVLK